MLEAFVAEAGVATWWPWLDEGGLNMPDVTVNLTEEEVRRLKELSGRVGLTVAQVAQIGIRDLVSQPDEAFSVAAQRVLEKNAELYRRLA